MITDLAREYLEDAAERFEKAGLKPSAFAGCSEEEVVNLWNLQARVLDETFDDYIHFLSRCDTNPRFAREYRKKKGQLRSLAGKNVGAASHPADARARAMIFENAGNFELDELVRYFFAFRATEADRSRKTPGKTTADPEECLRGYDRGVSGCLSLLILGFVIIGYLATLA